MQATTVSFLNGQGISEFHPWKKTLPQTTKCQLNLPLIRSNPIRYYCMFYLTRCQMSWNICPLTSSSVYTYIKLCDIPHLTLSRIYIFTVLGFFHTRQTCWQMWKDTKPQEICFLGPCHHRLTARNESACLSLFVVGWRICLFCSHGFVTADKYLWSPRREILQIYMAISMGKGLLCWI